MSRILYLEDDEDDVVLLQEQVAADGLAVELIHVRTPWDFTAALKSQTPDLVLLDGKVAGFGGVAAAHMAKAVHPAVPIFCLTGLVIEEKAVAMRQAGAMGCLSKQDYAAVSATLRRVLEDHGPAK